MEQNTNFVNISGYENPSHSAIAIKPINASEIRNAAIADPGLLTVVAIARETTRAATKAGVLRRVPPGK
jgi:hypothetical protein